MILPVSHNPSPIIAWTVFATRHALTVISFFALLMLAFFSPTGLRLSAEEILLEEIYVFVNDDVVTKLDFEEAFDLAKKDNAFTELSSRQVSNLVISNLIMERVVTYHASEIGVVVRDEEIETEIQRVMNQNNISSKTQFEQVLASQGLSMDAFERRIRQNLLTGAYINKEVRNDPPTDAEIRNYYEINKDGEFLIREPLYLLSQIFIKNDLRETFSKRREIQAHAANIRNDVFSGAISFREANAKYNEDRTSQSNNGLLNWVRAEKLPLSEEDRENLHTLSLGAITPLYASENGLFFYRIEERLTSGFIPFNIVANEIRINLLQQRRQDSYQSVFDNLRSKSYIKANVSFFDLEE